MKDFFGQAKPFCNNSWHDYLNPGKYTISCLLTISSYIARFYKTTGRYCLRPGVIPEQHRHTLRTPTAQHTDHEDIHGTAQTMKTFKGTTDPTTMVQLAPWDLP